MTACLSGCLSGCSPSLLDGVGPVGRDDAHIFLDALAIMLVIVVPTILLALWVAWRYRAGNANAVYLPHWSYSGRIEAVTWSIPILTILFIGGVIWIGSYRLDPFRPLPGPAPIEVQVVSLDWKWLFIYPGEGIATVNELVVPAGRPVHFSITSASVFNVFFVPRLGSMIYAMPGMVSQLHLQADRPVELFGQSSHFSGDGFSDMHFAVKSVDPAHYAAWLAAARRGPALDRPMYDALARQSGNLPVLAFGRVDPGLFHAVAMQQVPPAPGPQPGSIAHGGREAGGRH
ncbi:MAG: ubiquinol oxidase subunit II [Sphingomonadales bacterium]|nr:ubiquinol oxidase subunit II [Sphingomonadales bacterium]